MMFLKAENLSKSFDKNKKALDNINIELKTKKLCLLGQNGSGKTTFLSIIAGLISPSHGELFINGIEPYKKREETLKSASFIFEKPKFIYRMRVSEFIDFVLGNNDLNPDDSIYKSNISGFSKKRLFELSAGETQLLTIFSAFSSKNSMIIADEPFTHIDISRVGIMINNMQEMDKDLIFSTHLPDEAEAIGDYIIIFNDGKLIWHGTSENLYNSNIFEVFLIRGIKINLNYLFRYGNIALIESNMKTLTNLLESGKIIGFKKSGVRRIYEYNKTN